MPAESKTRTVWVWVSPNSRPSQQSSQPLVGVCVCVSECVGQFTGWPNGMLVSQCGVHLSPAALSITDLHCSVGQWRQQQDTMLQMTGLNIYSRERRRERERGVSTVNFTFDSYERATQAELLKYWTLFNIFFSRIFLWNVKMLSNLSLSCQLMNQKQDNSVLPLTWCSRQRFVLQHARLSYKVFVFYRTQAVDRRLIWRFVGLIDHFCPLAKKKKHIMAMMTTAHIIRHQDVMPVWESLNLFAC